MQGDHGAFADLVRLEIGPLDTAARLILRDPELARDAVQEGLNPGVAGQDVACAIRTGSTRGCTA